MAALAPGATTSAPATRASTSPIEPVGLNARQRAQLDKLRPAAMGSDLRAAREAFREIHSWGVGARRVLLDLLRGVLSRDKTAMEQAIANLKDPAKARLLEEQIDKLRDEALTNIGKLDKGQPVQAARDYFSQLLDRVGQHNQLAQHRVAIVDGLARRAEFLPLFRSIAPATDVSFNQLAETKLTQSAEKSLGMSVQAALAVPGLEDENGPKDGAARRVWFYRACRQIESYNTALARQIMDPEEYENLRWVNQYRECLGILPYELDARLVQSARRHSKEMVDLKYFAHESPTAGERSHADRMKNAGYRGGYSENIAYGPTGGEKTFWMWFDSPGHHKNMAGKSSAIGIGRWGNHWTQNMGRGKRLMLLSEEERAAVKVEGTILRPDATPVRGGRGR